jgi:hypothetical protein
VNTFGFGYSLQSTMLLNVATVGGGMFCFIPDAKIVGTNFVNAIANAATTLSICSKVHLIAKGGSSFVGAVGGNLLCDQMGSVYTVKLGNLQYGQGRDLVIPMLISPNSEDYLAVILEYEGYYLGAPHKIRYMASNRIPTADSVAAYARNLVVSETIQVVTDFVQGQSGKGTNSMKVLSDKVAEYDEAAENNDARLRGLVNDLMGFGEVGGRMSKAVSTPERFGRWGQHYLRNICRAHQLQVRANFMDGGLQAYGGNTFSQLQDIGGKIFVTLPMNRSKPHIETYTSNIPNTYQQQQQPQTNTQPVVDNTTYYGGAGGGCFDETCFVTVRTSCGKEVKTYLPNVKKNNFVRVVNNYGEQVFARVLCVVKINLGRIEKMIEFSSTELKITQKHPVWFNNAWKNPVDIASSNKDIAHISEATSNYVYNLVLEHSHVLLVNNMRCVTLGHGIKGAYHPFYGTSAVIDAIKSSPGYESGYVCVNGSIRNLVNSKGYSNELYSRTENVILF